jgi:hypothetical protein
VECGSTLVLCRRRARLALLTVFADLRRLDARAVGVDAEISGGVEVRRVEGPGWSSSTGEEVLYPASVLVPLSRPARIFLGFDLPLPSLRPLLFLLPLLALASSASSREPIELERLLDTDAVAVSRRGRSCLLVVGAESDMDGVSSAGEADFCD